MPCQNPQKHEVGTGLRLGLRVSRFRVEGLGFRADGLGLKV